MYKKVEEGLLKCNRNSTIREAMNKIDANVLGTVFIVNDNDQLCGVVTDGDIRRALLGGYGLNDKVKKIVKKDFTYANEKDDPNIITSKFSNKVKIIPIVDDDMHIKDFMEFYVNANLSLAVPQLNGNEYKYLMDAFLSTWISSAGGYVDKFESSFSEYCGKKYGIATANGTVALHMALLALGIGPGDEVIVPNLTFAATINVVIYTGAKPVIVDIEEDSWCMDPECMKAAITKKTKAVIPVHLYGQPCNMDEICKIADEHGIYVIEDCAEAHGAKWKGKRVGSFSTISCFSFYGNKVVTTGEGGMCLTDDPVLNEKMRLYRDHGMSKNRRYYHEVVGYNYRMTNLQAAIGAAQIEHIESILDWRIRLEDLYRRVFKDEDRVTFQLNNLKYRDKITWLVSVLVNPDKRDAVIQELKKNGVDVRAFFIPLNEMDIYKTYSVNECPVSRNISKMGINLPTIYEMNEKKIKRVFDVIHNVLED